jgi:hypothetical protein
LGRSLYICLSGPCPAHPPFSTFGSPIRFGKSERGHNLLTKVAELIDPFIGDWDEQLVDDTFEQQEASMIKLIPVQTDMEDFAACHLIRRVFFRCDLHIICKRWGKLGSSGRSESSRSGNMDLICAGDGSWLNIWDLPCRNKVKTFMWQFAHNALRRNLVRKPHVQQVW